MSHALPVLSQPGFLEDGGMVLLYLSEDRKIRFDVNDEAARDVGLEISPKLLRLKRSPER